VEKHGAIDFRVNKEEVCKAINVRDRRQAITKSFFMATLL
jgi:hypothetical protein